MNKKEISEIKKQFSPANCAITRICGCYVDADKNKKTELKEASFFLFPRRKCSNILKFLRKLFPVHLERI